MYKNYSVLMSVYHKESPEYLLESMESIYNQTIPTDDFVLVCDGPVGADIDNVIEKMQNKFGSVLNVVRLEKNSGLGNSLRAGLQHCKNNLVARMDSDDISFPNRCEKQLECFAKNDALSIVSGTILEFVDDINIITGKRIVPTTHDEICIFSRKRNPFNHPAVMFKKDAVEKAGGYSEEYPFFEDYYMWVRMLQNESIGANIESPILYMRTPVDMYARRGGIKYAKDMLRFHKWMKATGWANTRDYWTGAIPHAVVCIIPNWMRKILYKIIH